MRSLILNSFKDSLIKAVDDFLTKNLNQGSTENIYAALGAFTNTIQSLKSTIRAAEDPISLHTDIVDFMNYQLAGLRGFLPWCNESKLKAKIKLVLNDERYSVLALAKAHLLEKDEIINEKLGEIEALKKSLSSVPSEKGKEESVSSQKVVTALPSSQKTEKPNPSDALIEKKFAKLVAKNSALETQIQELKAEVATQENQKREIQAKYQEALVATEKQKEQIAELEQRVAQPSPRQMQKSPNKTPQRLNRGVFSR